MKNIALGVGENSESPELNVKEAVRSFKKPELIFFFSDERDFSYYGEALNKIYPEAVCIGCSAYRAWSNAGVKRMGITAMAIGN